MAEFVRIKGSGRPEEAIRHKKTRLELIASIKARLQTARKASPRPHDPSVIDHKRRQANDLD